MTVRATKIEILASVRANLLSDAEAVAGANRILSRSEQGQMAEGLLKRAAD